MENKRKIIENPSPQLRKEARRAVEKHPLTNKIQLTKTIFVGMDGEGFYNLYEDPA